MALQLKQLFILPFDHRNTFKEKLLGLKGNLNNKQKQLVSKAKQLVYRGYLHALKQKVVSKSNSGILVDEEFGSEIAGDCRKKKIQFAMCAEKSGQEEFDFEYGKKWSEHIIKFKPTFVKVLVRLNPAKENGKSNERQLKRLKLLSDFLGKQKMNLMFELLVPPVESQLHAVGNDKKVYDSKLRPDLTRQAIELIQKHGITPRIWKLEGFHDFNSCKIVFSQALKTKGSKVIILGRGESDEEVRKWLENGRKIENVIGFAVGRTVFWQALVDWKQGKISENKAVEEIAKNFKSFVDCWHLH